MRLRATTTSPRGSIATRRHAKAVRALGPRPAQSQLQAPRRHVAASAWTGSWSEYVDGPSDEDLGWRTDWDRAMIVGRQVGQGSFGVVHMGVCLSTGKEVAVKVLPKVRGKLTKEKTLEKLAREVEILQRLQSCGGVVQLEDCYEDTDNVRIVTELCAGGDLQRFAEDHGALNERSLALVALEVLKIVKACHDAGLLHGDVKPANFCLKSKLNNPLVNPELARPGATPQNWLKAIDFGCSQMLPAGGRRLSKRTGTPVYMAPEIFNRDYHREADVWSIGVMLYQLCSRRFPFWDNVETCRASKLEEVAQAVQEADISYNYGPWLRMSQEGREFVDGCLTRNVRRRMTVDEALAHPWFARVLQVDAAGNPAAVSSNNIVAKASSSNPVVIAASAKVPQMQDVPAAA